MIKVIIEIFFIPVLAYGIANWLMWQGMKKGSKLPVNKNLLDSGGKISRVVKFIYFIAIVKFSYENGLYYIFSFFPVWYTAGWLSTYIERILYEEKVLKMALDIINESSGELEEARKKLAESIPNWWVVLMPKEWSKKVEDSLRQIM